MRLGADDRTAIGDLVSRYNMAHDTDDAEGWLDTFTDDAVFVTGRSRSEGREQLPGVRHFICNAVFEGDAERVRIAPGPVLVVRAGEPPAPLLARRYRDTLRRGADGERRSGRREIAPG